MRRLDLQCALLITLFLCFVSPQGLTAGDHARGPFQPVFEAIKAEDLDKLRMLLHGRPEVLQRITQPTYERLVMTSSPRVFECLIDLGLDMNARDFSGRGALHWAVLKGDRNLADVMLSRGAHVDLFDNADATPLMYACAFAPAALAQDLIAHGADPDRADALGNTLVHFAAMARGDTAILDLLADRHPNFNTPNKAGLTPLMVACSAPPPAYFPQVGDPHTTIRVKRPTVQYLLDHGASVTALDATRRTILEFAVQADDPDLALRCIESGVPLNLKHLGLTPLDEALLQRCSTPLIECLAQHGGQAPYTDAAGNNHLHMRVAYHYLPPPTAATTAAAATATTSEVSSCDPAVPVLLDHGFPVDAVDQDGQTALHRACEGVNLASVAVLLDHRADPNTATTAGVRPLDIAVAKRDLDITRLLLQRGANPNLADNVGETPLHRLLTLSTPDEIRERLTASPDGHPSKYQQEVDLIYAAQRNRLNGLAWAGVLLLLACALQGLRIHQRRLVARLRAGANEIELPHAIWQSPQWKELVANAETARALNIRRLSLRPWFTLPLLAFCLGPELCLFDPVWYATLDTTQLVAIFLPGFVAIAACVILIFRPKWLRSLMPPIAAGAVLASAALTAWQGATLAIAYHFYAIGGLICLLALIQAAALALLIRLFQLHRAIHALKLPFDVTADPAPPTEAEDIESHHGWDEMKKV